MKLKKLDGLFYIENTKIEQALDFDIKSGRWDDAKIRGFGE
ncbi:hypothetical protein J2125_002536 [Erwinia toletana]|uniref:Uncharacterized protein n=1 Tax=Winslowiella toletana TaxID=92490 RepID=A0ABS4P9N6_9GAMM|nr:hypothetical protein [Winslowiella toletana]MBP2169344.1 hypothetical protein [Winslowiella toletana]